MGQESSRALADHLTAFQECRDEDTFRGLYRCLTPRLYRVALGWFGGREAEAEDAVQEAWLRAVAGWRVFRGESSVSTWMTGIVLRCCRERSRREALWKESQTPAGPTVPPFDVPLRIDLLRALWALAPGYREVVLLHDLEGLTHAEIAELLGIDEGTSKSQLSRARRSLREWIVTDRRDEHHDESIERTNG